jgi:XRE family transcriptional regulator, regulator of sulfur utilization
MDLGNTIKDIRKQKGISQTELADLCDISQTYLSQIENNQKEPNISILKVIADKLKIALPILFFLALNEADIAPGKKGIFQTIGPTVKTLIKELMTDE